jgi:uncharacterized protein (TIGR02145 family)
VQIQIYGKKSTLDTTYTQTWMAENLNVGTRIDGGQNMSQDTVTEKYCYDNDPVNCTVYGGLYRWDEMMNYTTADSATGICPTGWRLPSNYDWVNLVNFYGGLQIAEGAMKETGNEHWNAPNSDATNESGFTAIPGGVCLDYLYSGTYYHSLHTDAGFWTSTQSAQYPITSAWMWDLQHVTVSEIFNGTDSKVTGYAVRCIHD